jgi:hypothetical protein
VTTRWGTVWRFTACALLLSAGAGACSSDTSNPRTFASVQEFAVAFCQRSFECGATYPGGDKETCVRLQVGDVGFDLESACDAAWHQRCNAAMAKAPCMGNEAAIPSACREECH